MSQPNDAPKKKRNDDDVQQVLLEATSKKPLVVRRRPNVGNKSATAATAAFMGNKKRNNVEQQMSSSSSQKEIKRRKLSQDNNQTVDVGGDSNDFWGDEPVVGGVGSSGTTAAQQSHNKVFNRPVVSRAAFGNRENNGVDIDWMEEDNDNVDAVGRENLSDEHSSVCYEDSDKEVEDDDEYPADALDDSADHNTAGGDEHAQKPLQDTKEKEQRKTLMSMFHDRDEMNDLMESFYQMTKKYCIDERGSADEAPNANELLESLPPDFPMSSIRKNSTVGEFCKIILGVCAKRNISRSVAEDLIIETFRNTASLNLPVRFNERTNNYICDAFGFKQHDYYNVVLHMCIKRCCLFVGEHAEKLHCPVCGLPRFKPCTRNNCFEKTGVECDSFNTKKSHLAGRTPYQSMYYRPLMTKLMELYMLSQTTEPNIFTHDSSRFKREGYSCDVWDGETTKMHMSQMNENHAKIEGRYKQKHPHRKLRQCSLVFSMFYDGDEIYKSGCSNIWPLLASIWNCNPSYRTKLGLALFMVAVHDVSGSPAEQQFVDKVLSEELKRLEDGIIFSIDEENAVLLQARCLYMHLDTKAFEKYFHMQASGAFHGCGLCGDMYGISRSLLSKLVSFGHTLFIPDDHILKNIGENGFAPKGYYGGNIEINKKISRQYKASGEQVVVDVAKPKEKNRGNKVSPEVNAEAIKHKDRENLDESKYRWFNHDYPFELFAEATWVAYNDPRPYKKFKRQLHEVYVDHGIKAMRQGAEFNGVHQLSFWASLRHGMKMENMCYDLMHVIALSMFHFLNIMKGFRGLSEESRKMSLLMGRFDYLASDKYTPGWFMSLPYQSLADSVQGCILIPPKYSDYRFLYLFKHSGKINSYRKLLFAKAFIGFVLSFTDLSDPYKWFFRRYSSDLCGILNPIIQNCVVPTLCNSVIETRVVQEGIFPESEQQFIYHELIEIVHELKTFGVVDPLTCNTGERSLQELAAGVPRGGHNFLKTTELRFVDKELAKANNTTEYKTNAEFYTDNRGQYSPIVLKLHGKFPKLIEWSEFSKDNVASTVFEFAATQEIDQLQLRSPFCRLYLVHSTMLTVKGFQYKSISRWMSKLYSEYHRKVPFYADQVKHLVGGVRNRQPTDCDQIDQDVAEGIIYMSDFDGIVKDFALMASKSQKLKVYFEATIKGIHFDGRGTEFVEDTIEMETFTGTQSNKAGLNQRVLAKERNALKSTWDRHVGSWCLISDAYQPNNERKKKSKNKKSNEKPVYGKTGKKVAAGMSIDYKRYAAKFNYFCRLIWPSDAVLHGLSLGSAFLRKLHEKHNVDENRGGHFFVHSDDIRDYNPNKQFIVLNYVDSTAIGVCGVDEKGMPILSNTCTAKWVNDSYLKLSKEPLHKLFIIPLHPERLIPNVVKTSEGDDVEDAKFEKDCTYTTDYATIDLDQDGTKVFEN